MSSNVYPGVIDFYRQRIASCPLYGFKAGQELLSVIVRCASRDDMLTEDEFTTIINLANQIHYKMLEDDYNEGW